MSLTDTKIYQKTLEYGEGLFAARNLRPYEIVIAGKVVESTNHRTAYSFQIDDDRHVIVEKKLALINHSCDPNVIVKFNNFFIFYISIRKISIHEQICFDYETTEFELCGFDNCLCGSDKCRRKLYGFNQNKNLLLKTYPKEYFMPHLLKKL